MTVQNWTGNFNKFGTYLVYKLRGIRPYIILNSIFSLLSYPLLCGVLIPLSEVFKQREQFIQAHRNSYFDMMEYHALTEQQDTLTALSGSALAICIIMLMGVFVMSYVIPAASFRWLHRKTFTDMDYSLPVSDDTRFFGDLIASLAGTLVPHGVAVAIGVPLANISLPVLIGGFEGISSMTIQIALTGLFVCFMFTAITLFVMSVCGRTAEARIYPFVITAIIPLIHYVCYCLIYANVYGFEVSGDVMECTGLGATSPLGLLLVTFGYFLFAGIGYEETVAFPLFRAEVAVPAIIITLLLLVGAYFLIRLRRAERVGAPFVFKGVNSVIMALVTFSVTVWFALEILKRANGIEHGDYTGLLMAMIILSFVLYVLMEIISGRGFRKFYITLVRYIITLGACCLLCIGMFWSCGFGASYYVPAAADVSSVDFYIACVAEDDIDPYSGNALTDKEAIEHVISVHRDIPKQSTEFIQAGLVQIEYTLNDGSVIKREYCLDMDQLIKYHKQLYSKEVYISRAGSVDQFDEIRQVEVFNVNMDNYTSYDVNISVDEFMEAYKADAELATYEKVFGNESYERVTVSLQMNQNDMMTNSTFVSFRYIDVCTWNTNVLKLFEKYGIRVY